MKAKFTFEKDTKNTFRYREEGDSQVIGTLYIKKSTFDGRKPNKIEVIVEEVK